LSRVTAGVLVAPTSFFLITNFAAWAAMSQLYPRSLAGLGRAPSRATARTRQCLILANQLPKWAAGGPPFLLLATSGAGQCPCACNTV
jgi:hypothetical protein